jgi:2'-5' RNA ligase
MTRTPKRRSAEPRTRHRLFIAVPLPRSAIAAVESLVGDVRSQIADAETVRWVRLQGLHLTLRFLGWTEQTTIPSISRMVDSVAAGQDPFPVVIREGGAFPSIGRPRVLWLGITQGGEALGALEHALEPGLAALGWPPEARPFRPHLTLARSDGVRAGPATARALASAARDLDVRFDATHLVLFESVSGRGPAHYVAVHESRLGRHGKAALTDPPDAGDTIAAAGEPPRAGRKGALGAT